MKNHHSNNRRFGHANWWGTTGKPNNEYGRNKQTGPKSFTDRAKAHFAQLADRKPTFEDLAIVQQRHPSCQVEMGRLFGDGLEEAKLIIDLLPPQHVEHYEMRHRDDDSALLAEIWRVSEEGLDAITAWKISAGDDWGGLVEIQRVESACESGSSPCTELFGALLADLTPEIATDKFAMIVPLNNTLHFPRRRTINASFEDAVEMIRCLPSNHIQRLNLRLSETKEIVANVTQISKQAVAVLKAWENSGRSTDIDIVGEEFENLLRDEE
ncbi:MAG: hypothetical protein ACOYM3_16485 [Terrimicrobiaceae bacterium]